MTPHAARFLVAATLVSCGFAPRLTLAAQDCAALADLKIENTNLLSAAEVPAAGDVPAYCRVLGYVRPAINFEIRLPTRAWNGKFYMTGCGVYCGTLNSDAPRSVNAINFGLKRHYAVAVSDAGHWGSSLYDARWAVNNPVALMDWAQRAIPETTRAAKTLLRSYYGTQQRKAYYIGCSTGGRMGLMEAMRYPADFDGIVAGAPALYFTGVVGPLYAWVQQANTGTDGKPVLSPAKVKLLSETVAATCSERIGVKEPVIADPRACSFQPSALQCRAGDSAQCLTPAEVAAAEKIYRGPVNSRGQRLFPGGLPLSSEPFWPRWVLGDGVTPAQQARIGDDFGRYMLAPPSGPSYRLTDYDFDRDPARASYVSSLLDVATFDPGSGAMQVGDFGAFRRGAGKLIVWHGWADADVTPQATIEFYEALARQSGGMAATQEFARLFMVPSMDHCGIYTDGPGIADTGIDPLTALEQWVEEGKAPGELIATKTLPGSEQRLWQRPVCVYPKVAHYKGRGNPADAGSFTCAEPRTE